MAQHLKSNIITLVLAFVAGGAIMWAVQNNETVVETFSGESDHPIRQDNTKFQFIRPLLTTEGDKEDLKWFPAERKMKADVEAKIAEFPDVKVGMHFVNLTNSGWFGINGSESFIPASLLKLPLYTSYLKLREEGKINFSEVINYAGTDFDKVQNLGTGKIQPGNSYTVQQLLTAMIVESDNNALELLYQYKQDSLKDIFNDLQIDFPDKREEIAMNDFVTPRGISRFLVVLYNSSYLTRDDSEEALALLSQTNFRDGIVAGVGDNVKVSHKFGEREVEGADGVKELHDCGIVYHPKTPYILCVMTKGQDFEKQKEVIKSVSKVVYEHVSTFSTALKD